MVCKTCARAKGYKDVGLVSACNFKCSTIASIERLLPDNTRFCTTSGLSDSPNDFSDTDAVRYTFLRFSDTTGSQKGKKNPGTRECKEFDQ